MPWTAPRTWVAFEVVSAAIMNVHVKDNLLARKDVDDTHAAATAYAGHAGAGTHTHLSAGAEGGTLGGAAVSKDVVLHTVDKDGYAGFGGGDTFPAFVAVYGEDHGVHPGEVVFWVPNAAKNAQIEAARFNGSVDAPDFSPINNIVMLAGKTVDGVDVSVLKTFYDAHAAGIARTQHTAGLGLFYQDYYHVDSFVNANDTTWQDCDLTGYIDNGALIVFMRIRNVGAATLEVGVRPNGSALDRKVELLAGQSIIMPVHPDGDDVIETYSEDTDFIRFKVFGQIGIAGGDSI